jgi:hypothetical protein
MTQKKAAPKNADARRAHKEARTKANKTRRAAKHVKRLKQQDKAHPTNCPKVKRGTARALRRFCDRTSREFPSVLKGRYTMSMLVRAPKQQKPDNVAPTPLFKVNGVEVFSQAHASYMVRELAEQARARKSQEMNPAS